MIIETYLTEKLLGEILDNWAGAENVSRQPKVLGTRMRSDYEVKKNGRVIIVEFEGDSHYRDANVILRDRMKKKLQQDGGKEVVKIPYFIQLDKITFKHFFNDDFEISTTFPHGFITSKILPASFCPIGYNAAREIYDGLPLNVRQAVVDSLYGKAKEIPEDYVWFRKDYGGMSWEQFISKAREMHGNTYEYLRDL